jgi:hypothetical protein
MKKNNQNQNKKFKENHQKNDKQKELIITNN